MTTKRTIDTPYGWLRVASTIETDAEALRIQAFAYQAGDHDDAAMQDLCYDALAGDEDALRRVRSAMVPAPMTTTTETNTTTTTTTTTKSRITRVFWSIPGVSEGVTRTVRAAEAAMRVERSRVGPIYGYRVVERSDGSRERVPA